MMPRLALLLALAAGCALPGVLYEVAPAMQGRIHGDSISAESLFEATLSLRVIYTESADLFANREAPVSSSGRFAFESVELAVAGHEYGKDYRAFLYLRTGDQERVIWRGRFSRRALTGRPLEFDCDLDRPVRHGQPCWVVDALEHPWIAKQGERTYRRLCENCHGLDGGGVIGVGEDAPSSMPDLRTLAARSLGSFDRAIVSEWIDGRSLPKAHGSREMPVWGERLSVEYERYAHGEELVGATLDPLVTYLQTLQVPE